MRSISELLGQRIVPISIIHSFGSRSICIPKRLCSLFLNNILEEPEENFIYRLYRAVLLKRFSNSAAPRRLHPGVIVRKTHYCSGANKNWQRYQLPPYAGGTNEQMGGKRLVHQAMWGWYDYHPKESPMTDFHVMDMTFAV
jgi:hypothetical protein